MIALLLAAGLGTRLKPLTHTLPKPLIPVNGLPLIFYNLALLRQHGIREVVINLHHLGEQIRRALGNGRRFGLHIRYSYEPEILGTGGGIRKAARYFSQDILVINSDIISDINLKALMRQHRRDGNLATLVLKKHKRAAAYGLLHCRGHSLCSILGKPKPPANALAAHFTGVHIVRKEAVIRLPASRRKCIVQDVYIPALQAGEKMGSMLHPGYWTDCGTHAALAEAELNLARRVINLPLPYLHRLAQFYKSLTVPDT